MWRVGFWYVGIYNSSGISHYHHWVAGSELLVVGGWILLACQRMEKNIGQSNCPSLFILKRTNQYIQPSPSLKFESWREFSFPVQSFHPWWSLSNVNILVMTARTRIQPIGANKHLWLETLHFYFNNLLWLLGSHGSCDGGAEYDMMDSLTSMSNWHQGGHPLQPNWHRDARPQNTR